MKVPVYDILNCGPRSRFVANGKVVHNSKGSAINMQNLKRKSFLRKAIMAPKHYVCVVGDLSQIEPRVLAYMADYTDLLDIFRSGEDPYAMFGRQMFNMPELTKENSPDLRQSAKSALLGCFGPETPVLTRRGWVPIVRVQGTDTIWDGEEWVCHQGVLVQGEKDVLTAHGVSATSDHEILTGRGWVAWSEALANPSLLQSGLRLASLPASERLSTCTAESPPLRQRMQTYDIAYAGPRNRYTILTDAGPLIVHNCGYQLGWASFAAQLLAGFLGAPPIRYDKAFAKKLGVNAAYVERFLEWEDNVAKMQDIPHTCTAQELLIHCVAAKKIIDNYRATAYPIVGLWERYQGLIQSSLADGEEHTYKCLTFRKEEIVLPNGMSIAYPNLRQQKNAITKRPEWVYGPDATKLYAGKVCNNTTQGLARIIMSDGMLRTSKRYPLVGTVHDESISLAPELEQNEALKWVLHQMTLEPKYMPGIPLAADGGVHRRYGLAKT